MEKTGVFATKEELQHITNLIFVPHAHVFGPPFLNIREECYKLALKHGLPENPKMYSITKDGEFVKFK